MLGLSIAPDRSERTHGKRRLARGLSTKDARERAQRRRGGKRPARVGARERVERLRKRAAPCELLLAPVSERRGCRVEPDHATIVGISTPFE